jgi:uncharacterized oxidoreductase
LWQKDTLREASNKFPSVITKVCDLSVEAERNALYNWVLENHSDLNVLVNNAGIQNWIFLTTTFMKRPLLKSQQI